MTEECSGAGEREPPVCHLRARQSLYRQNTFDATRGVVSAKNGKAMKIEAKRASQTRFYACSERHNTKMQPASASAITY
jgi:hypothetical protein